MSMGSAGVCVHAMVSSMAMLLGMGLLGLGTYLKIVDPLQNIQLAYTENGGVNKILSISILAIITGCSMVLLSILGVWVSKGEGFRISIIAYTIVVIVVIVGLIFVCTVAMMVSKGEFLFGLREALEEAWENTVETEKEDACKIQRDFNCFGFEDNLCLGCNDTSSGRIRVCSQQELGQCAICTYTLTNTSRGCLSAIVNGMSKYYLPTGICTGIGGAVLVIDLGIIYYVL